MFNMRCICIAFFFLVYIYIGAFTGDLDLHGTSNVIGSYRKKIDDWLNQLDVDLQKFNSMSATLTWKLSAVSDDISAKQSMELGMARNNWKNRVCSSNIRQYWLTDVQKRKLYFLCRGPRFSQDLSRLYMQIMGQLSQSYNSEVCFPNNDMAYKFSKGIVYGGECLHGEPDLERLMKRNDLDPDQLKWIWMTWHNFVGPKIKQDYTSAIYIQNIAARNNDYHDMGEIWKEELEISQLEEKVFNLFKELKPLYVVLHAVIRHKLWKRYGTSVVDPKGPIPIHLLGNMWGQDWSSLISLFVPENKTVDLQKNLLSKNWTIKDMVLKSEDMYTSLGFPKMTEKFWKFSMFEENENTTICHGTAANLFVKDDFRMLLCGKMTMEDFYIIHHEMGHIEYYMAYEKQPMIFQEGANSAFHEAIGDTIMLGVMTPQHLYRLGLVKDEDLLDENLDHFLLLQQALTKIPEIPFSLIIDKYRWDVFKGKITPKEYNRAFWNLNFDIRGIRPPEHRSEDYFDAGSKFHVPDNTPYIRYFLSSILQIELFNSLCQLSLYGKIQGTDHNEIQIPLHRCDIYGSKKAGEKLKEMMSLGASQHWSKTLKIVTGQGYITTKSLLNYYQPIYKWLKEYVKMYEVYVGW